MAVKKKILHILAQKPGFTGSGIYLRSIINQADRYDCSQAVVCGIESGEDVSFDAKLQPRIYPVTFSSEALPFNVAGMSDVMPYPSTRYRDLDETKLKLWENAFKNEVTRAVNEFEPDLIIAHHLWLLSAITLQIATDIPSILISHGTGLRQKLFCPELAKKVVPSLKNANLILALNNLQKKTIIEELHIPSEKIVVNGNGYNSDIFHPVNRLPNTIPKLIYAGKIAYAKGLRELFASLGTINEKGIQFTLTICGRGSGEEEQSLKEYAKKLELPIEFLGNISQKELALEFQKSDVFILPSYYEGLPLVVIEALASGLKVVVNNLPGLQDWLGEELCSSNSINFVKMPNLYEADKPVKEDIFEYTNRLTHAIETAITQSSPNIAPCLSEHTWTAVFKRINKLAENL